MNHIFNSTFYTSKFRIGNCSKMFLSWAKFGENIGVAGSMKRIRIRIQVAKNQPKSWKISTTKNQPYHKNLIHFSKIINLCLTDINICLINNKTDIFFVEIYF